MKGFVYFISYPESGWVKVGYARDVEQRFATLQCSTPESLHVEAFVAANPSHERQLHKAIYGHHRREWFERRYVEELIELANAGESVETILETARTTKEAAKAKRAAEQDESLLNGWVICALDPDEPAYRRDFLRRLLEEAGEAHRLDGPTPDYPRILVCGRVA